MKWLIFFAYAALTTYVSLAPAGGQGLPLWDKAMHFTVYAIFAVLGSQLCRRPGQIAWVSLAILAYGGLLEVIQSFIGRDMSALDLLANGIGVAVGATLAARVQKQQRDKPGV
jgi:VanZ family protein